MVDHDNLLIYPDSNEMFKIHADASTFQFGAVVSQNSKPITFYIGKLTDDQQQYRVTVKKLLNIVETLKDFRTILIGQKFRTYIDHKSLIYKILIPTEY